jgi:hypothetical protein
MTIIAYRALCLALAAVLLACAGPAPAAKNEAIMGFSYDEILVRFGRSLDDLPALKQGEILTQDVDDSSDKELAVSLGMFIPAPPAEVAEAMRSVGWFADPDRMLASGELGEQATVGDLHGVVFPEEYDDAAEELVDGKIEGEYNLDAGEIAAFEELGERLDREDAPESVVRAETARIYREILIKRFHEYRRGGLSAIRPYVTEDGVVDLAAELTRSTRQEVLARRCFPEFCTALVDFPNHDTGVVEDRFFWMNQITDERPNFILAHRYLSEYEGGVIMSERRYYVAHTYLGQQVLVGVAALEQGAILFYVNRTISEKAAGFPVKLRHSIGTERLVERITAGFKRLREEFAQAGSEPRS